MEEKKKALFRHKLINQLNNMLLYLCKSSVPYVKFICLVFVSLHYTQLYCGSQSEMRDWRHTRLQYGHPTAVI